MRIIMPYLPLVFRIGDICFVLIPAFSTRAAHIPLRGGGTSRSRAGHGRGEHAELFGNLFRRGHVHHISGEPDNQIFGNHSTFFLKLPNQTVFASWKPKTNVRQVACHLANVFEMLNRINVAAIVKTHVAGMFFHPNKVCHRVHPKRMS